LPSNEHVSEADRLGREPLPGALQEELCGLLTQPEAGDHLVLYAAGGRKRISALAEVVSGVYDAGSDFDGRWPYRVDVRYLVNVPAREGVHINEVSTPARDLLRSVGRQSYIRLSPEEYQKAASKLQEVAGSE
jgi:hypothetical protein